MEVPDGDTCCGSAGLYNVEHPDIAAALGASKAEAIRATGAQAVAAGNIGCLVQIDDDRSAAAGARHPGAPYDGAARRGAGPGSIDLGGETLMRVRLAYGSNGLDVEVPFKRTTVIEPEFRCLAAADPVAALPAALRAPIGRPAVARAGPSRARPSPSRCATAPARSRGT